MDVQEILPQLATNTRTFPREAVAQAIAQRETMTPELLRVLVEAQHNIEHLRESESMTHIYAMYLLAQFREPRAYPLIVEFFSIPGDIALDTTGDVATEDLGRILASVSCGDIRLMTALVENEHANEYVRVAALRGLLTLVACGEQSRDAISWRITNNSSKARLPEIFPLCGMAWYRRVMPSILRNSTTISSTPMTMISSRHFSFDSTTLTRRCNVGKSVSSMSYTTISAIA